MIMTINLPDTIQYYIEQKILDEKKVADIINDYINSLTEVKNKNIKISVDPILWSEEVLWTEDHNNFINILKAA